MPTEISSVFFHVAGREYAIISRYFEWFLFLHGFGWYLNRSIPTRIKIRNVTEGNRKLKRKKVEGKKEKEKKVRQMNEGSSVLPHFTPLSTVVLNQPEKKILIRKRRAPFGGGASFPMVVFQSPQVASHHLYKSPTSFNPLAQLRCNGVFFCVSHQRRVQHVSLRRPWTLRKASPKSRQKPRPVHAGDCTVAMAGADGLQW